MPPPHPGGSRPQLVFAVFSSTCGFRQSIASPLIGWRFEANWHIELASRLPNHCSMAGRSVEAQSPVSQSINLEARCRNRCMSDYAVGRQRVFLSVSVLQPKIVSLILASCLVLCQPGYFMNNLLRPRMWPSFRRPRVSCPATYPSGTPRAQHPAVARWHAHLHGLATAIHETSGLGEAP